MTKIGGPSYINKWSYQATCILILLFQVWCDQHQDLFHPEGRSRLLLVWNATPSPSGLLCSSDWVLLPSTKIESTNLLSLTHTLAVVCLLCEPTCMVKIIIIDCLQSEELWTYLTKKLSSKCGIHV